MTLIQTFHGTASNGTPLTAVMPSSGCRRSFALVFPAAICRDSCIRSPAHRKP